MPKPVQLVQIIKRRLYKCLKYQNNLSPGWCVSRCDEDGQDPSSSP